MAQDNSYDTQIAILQGGAIMQVGATGTINIVNGGQITADGVSTPTVTAPVGTGSTSTTPFGYTQTQADAITAWIRAVDAQLRLLGIVK